MAPEKVTGTVVVEGGEYFLSMPSLTKKRKKELILLGEGIDKETISQLAGTKVEVLLSEPQQFVAGIVGHENPALKRIRIMCYKPRPDLFAAYTIDPEIKATLGKQFVEAGVFSQKTYEQLISQ